MAPNIQGEPKECLWALLFDPYDQGGMSVQPKALWGVYNANGGIAGELAYVFGKIRGPMHCALCDITHATVSKKDEWKTLEDECTLPLHLVHNPLSHHIFSKPKSEYHCHPPRFHTYRCPFREA